MSFQLESMGQPVAWKAGSHLAIVVKTNIENLSVIGFNFVGGEFVIDHKLPVVRVQSKYENLSLLCTADIVISTYPCDIL